MNRRMTIVAVAALIIGIILGGGMIALAASPLQQADVAQWEYRVIECSGPASMAARYYVAVGNAV